jgi:uncharacterized protein YqeY
MLRDEINDALKTAIKAKEARRTGTLRLVLAALKDRDIADRAKERAEGISDDEILQMLQTMVRQRRESIEMYEKGRREDLARQEAEEIGVIEEFLPRQMSEAEIEGAVKEAIAEIGATGLKDMGRTMAALKERCAGRMDFAKANSIVKGQLS